MKKLIFFFAICAELQFSNAQNVAINNDGSAANSSAMLDIKANNKGLLIPRTSTASRTSIATPAKGLFVYDTTSDSFWYHDGADWKELIRGSGTAWSTSGNSGTNTGVNFLGTTDNAPLQFRANNERAGFIDVTTSGNVSFGYQGGSVGQGSNTAIGYQSMRTNNGSTNTAVGYMAITYNWGGHLNTAIGYTALKNNLAGIGNSVVGSNTMGGNVTGNWNSVIGAGALFYNYNGSFNTVAGFAAMENNNNGSNNCAFGASSLRYSTNAEQNVAIGAESLYMQNYNWGGSTLWSTDNIAVGFRSLYNNNPTSYTNGYQNTAIGSQSLYSNTTGFQNTAIGYMAGYYNLTGNANVFLGYNAGLDEKGSNKLYIANSGTVTPLIGGDFSTNTVTVNSLLTLTPTTQPANPEKGMVYFDNGNNKLRCWDGTGWNNLW